VSKKKTLLTFAGFDPSSGAGVLLDVSAFRSLGFHGAAVITSLTAQNTEGILSTFCPPADFVWDQCRAIEEDMTLSGMKTGMLGCRQNLAVLSKILSHHPGIPRVVDPVFQSTSGTWLFDKNAVADFIESIKGKASLLTPNTQEAMLIAKGSIKNTEGMKAAAEKIYAQCGFPCLVTGGNFKDSVFDILFDGHTFHLYENKKIAKKVHGTGCYLSSCILGYLVLGKDLDVACAKAISATHDAIERAEPVGRGQHIILI
jgi:hydroxymethylpyrimidine/phosphomethylpyrimidine kinase